LLGHETRLYGITVWDLRTLLSCCWGYSLGLFFTLLLLQLSYHHTIAEDTNKHQLKTSHQESTTNDRSTTTTKNNDYSSKKSKT
jgi:hypothetical protein